MARFQPRQRSPPRAAARVMAGPRGAWRKAAGGLLAAVALAAVFAAYLNPHLVVDLANRVWACF